MAAKVSPEESAPTQQAMDPRFALPSNAKPLFRTGPGGSINWEQWKSFQKPPRVYDPPQFAPGWLSICPCVNWWNQRSPLCAWPAIPCCCAASIYACCVRNVTYIQLSSPDDWMEKLLSTGTSPNCPEWVKGIWWMQDNISAHEHLLTWHDAEWVTDSFAIKNLSHNWSRGPTAFGAFLACFVKLNGNMLRAYLSPDRRWIAIAGTNGDPTWIYIPSTDESISLPDGSALDRDPGEMMRVSYNDDADPQSGISYQYRVRRIAFLDERGKLVKTRAYDDLSKLVSMPLVAPRCYCTCLSREARAYGNLPHLPAWTVVKLAPPPPNSK